MLRWPDETLFGGIAAVAAESPEATALVTEDGTVSYADLLDRSRAVAAGLREAGVEADDTVALWLANRPEWITLQLGAAHLGAAVVAVNTRYRTHELEHLLSDADCRLLVTESGFADRDYLATVADLVPAIAESPPADLSSDRFPNLTAVVALSGDDRYSGVESFAAFRGRPEAAGDPATDPTAPACVFYTSGTTGDPKGCLQSHRSLLNHSYAVGDHLGVGTDDVALGALPFCGVMGYNAFMSALTHGIPLVLLPRFEPGPALSRIESHGVTYFSAIGEMYRRLVDHDAFAPDRVESLACGAVAFVNGFDDATFDRIEDAVGFPLVQPYGLSEANSQVFVGDPDAPRSARKRVGGPLVHPVEEDAMVVDPETGERVADGEAGELYLRGYNVMNGYLGRPEATADTLDEDGWLHTGDLCVREADGAFVYRSRLDDALRIRGFLVSPADVETPLEARDDVDAAEVVGVDHPHHGQVPVAFVQGAPDLDGDTIRAALVERIADYKVPERVVRVEAFPRTEGPHGAKVQKAKLRERARALLDGD
ncbi:class I adenylate-forming enzyme family protein [Halobacteriales archaeon Cl-PHB]